MQTNNKNINKSRLLGSFYDQKNQISNFINKFNKAFVICGVLTVILYILGFYQNKIERRYGFVASTPELSYLPYHVEVLMISNVKIGGIFSKAGFKVDDIIVESDSHSVGAFHRSLDKPKGTVIEFETISRDKYNLDNNHNKTEIKRVIAP